MIAQTLIGTDPPRRGPVQEQPAQEQPALDHPEPARHSPIVAELAHDFNNLRLALSSCLGLIRRQSSESRMVDIASRGLDTVERIDRLVEQLLAIAHQAVDQAAAPADALSVTSTTHPPLDPARRSTILVIDDDDVRPVLAELLRSLDYEVVEAANGRAGIAAAEASPRPDLAIVDYVLPGLSGGETIAELRARRPDLPLAISTGHSELDALEPRWRGLPILHKPFRIAELAKTVAALLAPGLHRPS